MTSPRTRFKRKFADNLQHGRLPGGGKELRGGVKYTQQDLQKLLDALAAFLGEVRKHWKSA